MHESHLNWMSNGLINTSALSHLDSASTVQVEEALSSHFLDAVKVPPEHCYLGMSKGKVRCYTVSCA